MSDHETPAKRRKVRKGTQSCWECRRRKVRCIFSVSTNTVCDHCARRKTPCVSQEICEKPFSGVKTSVEVRIGRVEELLGQLADPHDFRRPRHDQPSSVNCHDGVDTTVSISSHGSELEEDESVSCSPAFRLLPLSNGDKFASLNRELMSAWPSKDDFDLITALPIGLSSHLHLEVCSSRSDLLGSDTLQTIELLRLPPPGSHPVLFARKLLMLGIFLQGVLPSSMRNREGFSPNQIMHRAISTATTLVTTQDEFLDSVEAVESILLESMYHNYTGNLHRAWKAIRRAITTAQSLSLHLGFASPTLKLLDSSSRAHLDLNNLIFRIAEMDSYLSLLLGLPSSSLQTTQLTSPSALSTCTPLSRLSRLHLAVQTQILARCPNSIPNVAETASLDGTLRSAAQEMPPKWWLPPLFADPTHTTDDMIRLMTHLSHYHLVLRLHLPLVLAPHHESSKSIAVGAAREILTRYVTFRNTNTAHYYCRGSDFLSFIAVTVLCAAHIKHGAATKNGDDTQGSGALGHARLGDRGLMERALELVMEVKDGISGRIEWILGNLLEVERRAAEGTVYEAMATAEPIAGAECGGRGIGEEELEVWIPGFGRIDFVKGIVDRGVEDRNAGTDRDAVLDGCVTTAHNSPAAAGETNHPGIQNFSPHSNNIPPEAIEFDIGWAAHEFDLQGVDFALFDGLFCNSATIDDTPGLFAESH